MGMSARSENLLKAPDGFARVFSRTRETPALGTAELLAGYDKFPWIRAISDKIGQGIGSIKWELMAGDLEVENHPLLDLLRRPNPAMSGAAFFKWSGTHFALTNEIFWLIERNGLGMPIELWPIPASWVMNIPNLGADDGEYEVAFKGMRTFFPAMDIIYIRDFSPSNPYSRSSSPAIALGDEIESDEFAAKYVKSFFLNSARPDLLIYSKDKENPIDRESAERLERNWVEKLQGFWKRHKPFFMPGEVGIHDLQSDLKSMDLVDQRKWWRDIAIQVYGIPPEALGIIENSNRATIHSAEFFLTKHVIVPRTDIIKDGMSNQLAPQFDTRLSLTYQSPVQEDREHKLEVTKAHPHAFSLDEIREDAGREELPDGKGDIYPHAFNTLFSEEPGGSTASVKPTDSPSDPKALEHQNQRALADTTIKAPLDENLIDEILAVMGTDEFNPHVLLANQETVAAFGTQIIQQVGANVDFAISAARVEEFLLTQSSGRITGFINETTRVNLRKTLSEGSAAGEGAATLSKRITTEFEEARGKRAFKIARTESVRAANFGALAGMKQVGVRQKQWLAVGDPDTRESHQVMNGQIVDTNNSFRAPSGAQAAYPGAFGIAEEDIECRCSILAVIQPQNADIDIPSQKDFERERQPYERLIEHAYVRGFDAQEQLVMEAFNQTQ